MIDATEVIHDLQEMRDEGHLSDALIRRAIRSIAKADDRCSWVGAYLLKAEENHIWLHNYIGSPTDHARIPVGEGVSGAAMSEKANRNVPDVSSVEDSMVSSPDVRSSLVVLIRAGDEIFGEIAMESEAKGAFSDEDEAAVQTISDKLAEQLMAERR
ncbi:MAG TPA: GAF domain-containing protein [Longimicrobiales bacterium]|jgi:GAF domain-containing protein